MLSLHNLFSKKESHLPDLSILKTDIHSHLLPGVDDGSADVEESLAMIKKLSELKYEKLILTPHINHGYPENKPAFLKAVFEKLLHRIKEEGINISLELAAEYLLDDMFETHFSNGNLMTFGKKYLLIELSYYFPPVNLNNVIFNLQIEGYKVVLAHPERYVYWHNSFQTFEDLKNRNVYFQLNMVSLTGVYSHQVRRFAEKLVDNQMVDFTGTDLHHLEYFKLIDDSMAEPYLHKLLASPKLLNNTL